MRQSYAAMVLDLDWFKHVNDRFGHLAGDAVLVEVASRLRANLRAEDLLARIGGEEFLVVIPNTTLDTARATAERLRNVVSESPIVHLGISKSIRVTISVGLSISGPDKGSASMDIIRAADRALLIAKSQGRNVVETWSSAA
jgi:two-component system cell cycle response regulator